MSTVIWIIAKAVAKATEVASLSGKLFRNAFAALLSSFFVPLFQYGFQWFSTDINSMTIPGLANLLRSQARPAVEQLITEVRGSDIMISWVGWFYVLLGIPSLFWALTNIVLPVLLISCVVRVSVTLFRLIGTAAGAASAG